MNKNITYEEQSSWMTIFLLLTGIACSVEITTVNIAQSLKMISPLPSSVVVLIGLLTPVIPFILATVISKRLYVGYARNSQHFKKKIRWWL